MIDEVKKSMRWGGGIHVEGLHRKGRLYVIGQIQVDLVMGTCDSWHFSVFSVKIWSEKTKWEVEERDCWFEKRGEQCKIDVFKVGEEIFWENLIGLRQQIELST